MAFVVKNIDLDELSNKTGEFTYEPLGLTVTFKSFTNDKFQKAYSMLNTKLSADMQALQEKPLDDSFFDNIDDGKTADELMVDAIAKFLIADWDVVNENGDKLPVTPQNLKLLLANINDQNSFIKWCTSSAAEVARVERDVVNKARKKPSNATSGKKTTGA